MSLSEVQQHALRAKAARERRRAMFAEARAHLLHARIAAGDAEGVFFFCNLAVSYRDYARSALQNALAYDRMAERGASS